MKDTHNTVTTVVDINKAEKNLRNKTWDRTILLALGINADATQVFAMTAEIGGKEEASYLIDIDQDTRRKFAFLGEMQDDDKKMLVAHEPRIGKLLASNDPDIRQRMAKLFGAMRGWKDCFLSLPTDHEELQTSIGTAEHLQLLSNGQKGDLKNVRLVGPNAAIASKGNRLYVAFADDKGAITANTRWSRKFDFNDDVAFLSRVDQDRKLAVATLNGGKYNIVQLDRLFTDDQNPTLQVSSTFTGNGDYIVGLTPRGDAVATIGHTQYGDRTVRTTPFNKNGMTKRSGSVISEAYATA